VEKRKVTDIKSSQHQYETIIKREDFQTELTELQQTYVGRPSPIFHAKRLSEKLGGAQIHLKQEQLNFTGSHKM
jgi:tryptophan synthase beta chain